MLKKFGADHLDPIIKSYLDLVRAIQPAGKLKYYPGSPFIMRKLLRPQDKLILNELHPEDYKILKKQFCGQNIHIHNRDAYEFLPAILPPKPRRGLIFIDPPYEIENEFTKLINLLVNVIKLFPQGVFVLWYPIVHNQHQKFLHDIYNLKIEKTTHFELTLTKNFDKNKNGLRGSGIVIINAPYKIESTIRPIAKCLEDFL
jgi:23S rRNA (adenine2030-N6)-methyltransferase